MRSENDWLVRELRAVEKATQEGRYLEAPLTNAIGCMLHNDPLAAASVCRLILEAFRPNGSQVRLPPKSLWCKPEQRFYNRAWNIDRRADLYFRSDAGDYALVIECKLDADTSKHQIKDHLKAPPKRFDSDLTGRNIYFALLTNRAIVAHERTRSKRWLGAGTWGEVHQRLAAVRFEDVDRAESWHRVFTHYAPLWVGDVDGRSFDSPRQLLDAAVPVALRRLGRDVAIKAVPQTARGWIVRGSGSSARFSVKAGREAVNVTLVRTAEGAGLVLSTSRNDARRRSVPAENQLLAFQNQLTRELRRAIHTR
jgi:hypothetical protein